VDLSGGSQGDDGDHGIELFNLLDPPIIPADDCVQGPAFLYRTDLAITVLNGIPELKKVPRWQHVDSGG
jgi:hypothetical protein